jgi:hypothetical protein
MCLRAKGNNSFFNNWIKLDGIIVNRKGVKKDPSFIMLLLSVGGTKVYAREIESGHSCTFMNEGEILLHAKKRRSKK